MDEKTDSGADKAKENERERLRSKLKMFGTMASMVASQGLVKTTRLAKPLIHGYTGCDDDDQQYDDSASGDPQSPNSLSQSEKALLMNAGAKLAFETIELATLAYPPTDGIEPYRAVKDPSTGCYPAPHLAHVLSLGKAVQDQFGTQLFGSDQKPPEQEAVEMANKEPVLLTALGNNDYGYLNSPVEPRTIRRVALNERDRTINTTQSSNSRSVRR